MGRTQVKEGDSKKEKYLFPRRQSEDVQACLYHPGAPVRVEFDLTMQARCGIVAISVSGYSVNTEYSGYKVSISTEVLFGAFFALRKNSAQLLWFPPAGQVEINIC